MALIHSKQLNPKLTGSFTISGSDALNTIGGITNTGGIVNTGGITSDNLTLTHITASGNISASGTVFASKFESAGDAGEIISFNDNLNITGHITASGGVNVSGDIEVGQYIKHKGDINTFVNFTDNRIRFQAGGVAMLGMHKDGDAPYPVTVNNGGNRVNFRVNDRNTELLLKTDSEAFNVGLYYAGNKKLETVKGGVDITGHVTASGNISSSATITAFQYGGDISGSSTSTGSFGKIELNDGTHLNAGKFAISGSSISTASFGVVKVHAIEGASPITFNDTIIENQNLIVQGFISGSGDIKTSGNVIASRFVASGSDSMQFGETSADKHEFTGSVVVTGSLNTESGRIFEQGTSVIDHATAMAIVFGG